VSPHSPVFRCSQRAPRVERDVMSGDRECLWCTIQADPGRRRVQGNIALLLTVSPPGPSADGQGEQNRSNGCFSQKNRFRHANLERPGSVLCPITRRHATPQITHIYGYYSVDLFRFIVDQVCWPKQPMEISYSVLLCTQASGPHPHLTSLLETEIKSRSARGGVRYPGNSEEKTKRKQEKRKKSDRVHSAYSTIARDSGR